MSQLQKKSFVASLMGHIVLLAVLVAGPTFLVAKYQSTNSTASDSTDLTITILPNEQVEKALTGSAAPQLPLPQSPQVTTPRPSPKLPQIDPVLRTRTVKQPALQQGDFADAAENIRQQVQGAADVIRKQTGSSRAAETIVSGNNAAAEYREAVKAAYDDAWFVPDEVANDDATVKVSVTILRSGVVAASEILHRSGVAPLDKSIASTLDRVKTVDRPFPDDDPETQRTFIINFNLRSKRPL